MRTLAITQNLSADGSPEFLGDWFDPGDQAEDLAAEVRRQSETEDYLLLGRQTFTDFRSYWPHQTDDPTGVAELLDNVQKLVVSSTLGDPGWQNSTVLGEGWRDRVRELKAEDGGDIVCTGSLMLSQALIGRGWRTSSGSSPTRLSRSAGAACSPTATSAGCGCRTAGRSPTAWCWSSTGRSEAPSRPGGPGRSRSGTRCRSGPGCAGACPATGRPRPPGPGPPRSPSGPPPGHARRSSLWSGADRPARSRPRPGPGARPAPPRRCPGTRPGPGRHAGPPRRGAQDRAAGPPRHRPACSPGRPGRAR